MMTKSQVVAHLAEKTGIQKKAAAAVMEELADLATKQTKGGGQFVIPGLGKAVKANRKARMGRNPQTGEAIKIPAKTVVKFRLAKAFKDAVVPPKKKQLRTDYRALRRAFPSTPAAGLGVSVTSQRDLRCSWQLRPPSGERGLPSSPTCASRTSSSAALES